MHFRQMMFSSSWLLSGITSILLACYIFIFRFEVVIIEQYESTFVHPSFSNSQYLGQTFHASIPFSSIRVKLATFGQVAACDLRVKLTRLVPTPSPDIVSRYRQSDTRSFVLYENTVSFDTISDNSYSELIRMSASVSTHIFPPGDYVIELYPGELCEDMMISPWFSGFDTYDEGTLLLNGLPEPGDVAIRISHRLTLFQIFSESMQQLIDKKGVIFPGVLMTLFFGWLSTAIHMLVKGIEE